MSLCDTTIIMAVKQGNEHRCENIINDIIQGWERDMTLVPYK